MPRNRGAAISSAEPDTGATAGSSKVSGNPATAGIDGMWRSIWACKQALHEHSGIDTPVWEQTVIRFPYRAVISR
jgi:hypothetical protein